MPSLRSLCSPLFFLQRVSTAEKLWSRQLLVQVCFRRTTFLKPTFPPQSVFSTVSHWKDMAFWEDLHFALQLANPPSQETNLICVWLYQVKQHKFVLRNSLIWLEHMYWNSAQKSIDNCEFLYFGSGEETDCFFSSYTLLFCSLWAPFPLGRKSNMNLCLGRAQVFLLALSFLATALSLFPFVYIWSK